MHIRLGYDTYSLRSWKWDAMRHLDFASQQGLDAIQFSSNDDYGDTSPEALRRVKNRAAELGIRIDAGTGCVCELSKSWNGKDGSPRQVLEQGLDIAHTVGATAMRCFMGSQLDRFGDRPLDELTQALVKNFKSVRSKALDLGVKIAIENHKDLQAWQVKQVIEQAGPDFVGSNLDLGNPTDVMENPLTTLEMLGPYAVTTHVRDTAVYEDRRGAAVQWTALGGRQRGFEDNRGALQGTLSERVVSARNHHRAASADTALSRSCVLENVPGNARFVVRQFHNPCEIRTAVRRPHGDRRCGRPCSGSAVSRGADLSAAVRSRTKLQVCERSAGGRQAGMNQATSGSRNRLGSPK